MNAVIRNISLILLLTLYACSNDFLDENLTTIKTPAGESTIFISPNWEEFDYYFNCPNMGDSDFKIEETPTWLKVANKTGQLNNGVGTIQCTATKDPKFDKIGVYVDKMKVSVGGKIFWIPVSYITEGQPKIEVQESLLIDNFQFNSSVISIRNVGNGILFWDIESMPEWLEIDTDRIGTPNPIVPQDGLSELALKIKPGELTVNSISGLLMLKTNDKSNQNVTIVVSVELGNPTLSLYTYNATLDFGRTETSKNISFSNQGNGLLLWTLENIPEWLSVSKISGIVSGYYSENINFTCNRDLLPTGQSEAKVILKTNDPKTPSQVLTVRVRNGNSTDNVKAINGKITDVFYDKSTDILYYATTQPDKLIAYNTKTRTIENELSLSKAPTCFDISEDGKIAAVGHGGLISAIDMVTFKVTNTYEVSTTVYDIAWTKENLFCYSELINYSDYLYWIDTSNGVQTKIYDQSIDGKTCIKKAPSKPYVIATRRYTSPNGIFVYDISSKAVRSYSHQDLYDFWFVNDGLYLIAKSGRVFRTSSILDVTDTFNSSISSTDQMKKDISNNYYPIWVDYSLANKSVWGLESSGYLISQFDDTNYALLKTYSYDDYYQINNVGYTVQAQYVFANATGTELIVIRNATSINAWSLEFITVSK